MTTKLNSKVFEDAAELIGSGYNDERFACHALESLPPNNPCFILFKSMWEPLDAKPRAKWFSSYGDCYSKESLWERTSALMETAIALRDWQRRNK